MFSLKKIDIGDLVEVEFVEKLPRGDFIVSFSGDLLRVKNRSAIGFVPGQKVKLVVRGLSPLALGLAQTFVSEVLARPRIDRRI